jgi:hydroxyacylglutathione hydrolase
MRVVPIPLLRDNYAYLVICEKTGEAGVVDASEARPVLERVAEERVNLVAILSTHHHWDHTGGNVDLLGKKPLRVYGHRSDRGRVPGLNRPLEEGDRVDIGALTGRVLFIPGHTRGHIAYLFDDRLFCGDTLFVAGCGRPFEGTPAELHSSLDKLSRLPDATQIYCGHEYTQKNLTFALTVDPFNAEAAQKLRRVAALRAKGRPTVPSTMIEERATNPFLRCHHKEIQETICGRFPDIERDPVSVFAKVRELKDRF